MFMDTCLEANLVSMSELTEYARQRLADVAISQEILLCQYDFVVSLLAYTFIPISSLPICCYDPPRSIYSGPGDVRPL